MQVSTWRNGSPVHCRWERKLMQPLEKTVQTFLQTLETELPLGPTVSVLGICPRESKAETWKSARPWPWQRHAQQTKGGKNQGFIHG